MKYFFCLRLQKMSSRHLQDILIKTNIFTLVISLQKTFSRRLQDVLIKTNIFVLVICLQDVFKMFLRYLQDILLRGLQGVFKTSCQNVFLKMSSKHLQADFETYSTHVSEGLRRRLSIERF